jgi:hypothetical protein
MSIIATELPHDDDYPIAWLNWSTWAISEWIEANCWTLVREWIAEIQRSAGIASIEKLMTMLVGQLEAAWAPSGIWHHELPGYEKGIFRDGTDGLIDVAMQFVDWHQIAIHLLDLGDERIDTSANEISMPELSPERLREVASVVDDVLSKAIRHLHVVRPSSTPLSDAVDAEALLADWTPVTLAAAAWIEGSGAVPRLVQEASTEGGNDEDVVIEVLAEDLRAWLAEAALRTVADRDRRGSGDLLDGPFRGQTFRHWLLEAAIEDANCFAIAELFVRHAKQGNTSK